MPGNPGAEDSMKRFVVVPFFLFALISASSLWAEEAAPAPTDETPVPAPADGTPGPAPAPGGDGEPDCN